MQVPFNIPRAEPGCFVRKRAAAWPAVAPVMGPLVRQAPIIEHEG